MGKYKDLSGLVFGKLKVVKRVGTSRSKKPIFEVICECGKTKNVINTTLTKGQIHNCGCCKSKKHGLSKTKEYRVWADMLSRCRDSKSKNYPSYGGRGISVCSQWLGSFETFIRDMGERPSSKHSLDRIDNNGDYEPSNCRWVTREVQDNNRRSNIFFTYNGETKTLTQWAVCLGVLPNTFRSYLQTHSFEETYTRYAERKG